MKTEKVVSLYLIGTACLGSAAAFADDINETLDAAEDGTITVSNVAGAVEVTGWSRRQVEVTGELGRRVEELIFERDDDEVLIKVKVPRRSSGGISSDLYIKVPEDSSLEINTVSADIEVSDVNGELELDSVSGDISTDARGSFVELGSVSGDIDVEGDNQTARTRISTVSGDVEAENLSGEISVESVNGDLSVVDGSFSRVRAETVNGTIVYHARLLNDGRLDMETVNGTIDIDFNGDVSSPFRYRDIQRFNQELFRSGSSQNQQVHAGSRTEVYGGRGHRTCDYPDLERKSAPV